MLHDFDLEVWDFERAKAFASAIRRQGGSIGFTNGCFELFHYGHLQFLKKCRSLIHYRGSLVVAVNSDSSLEQLKKRKPLIPDVYRRAIVAGMACVSMAFIWDSLRVTEAIRVLEPEQWFKGGDYTLDTLDKGEVEAANAAGTKIELLELVRGTSTSKIVEHIRKTGTPPKSVGR